mmetsp:Transcript_4480/g.15538  ORF Transcript_4480/g.15538 Transcript_4480/m.15538 type:complete len:198 (-) Transcript_4480:245-838(-)
MGNIAATSLSLTQHDLEDVQAHTQHHFTMEEIQSLYRRFRALDRGHKGFIAPDELLKLPELAMNPLAQRILQVFENVNFKAFCSLLSVFSGRASREDKLRFIFQVYDIDGDGYVSRTDLLVMLRHLAGSSLSEEQLADLAHRCLREGRSWAADEAEPRLAFEDFERVWNAGAAEDDGPARTDASQPENILRLKIPSM